MWHYRAPVAQLDSASVFGTEGCRFESCRAYLLLRTSAHENHWGLTRGSDQDVTVEMANNAAGLLISLTVKNPTTGH